MQVKGINPPTCALSPLWRVFEVRVFTERFQSKLPTQYVSFFYVHYYVNAKNTNK
jgi:hypothetical protein